MHMQIYNADDRSNDISYIYKMNTTFVFGDFCSTPLKFTTTHAAYQINSLYMCHI